MKKTILIGVSIATVLAILLAAVALGFGDTSTKFNAFSSAETDNTSVSAPPEDKAALEAQTKVSFKILQPTYILEG